LLQDASENQRANLEAAHCSGEHNLQAVRCVELIFSHTTTCVAVGMNT